MKMPHNQQLEQTWLLSWFVLQILGNDRSEKGDASETGSIMLLGWQHKRLPT